VPDHGRAIVAGVYAVVSVALLIRFAVGVGRIWRIRQAALRVGLDARSRRPSSVSIVEPRDVRLDHTPASVSLILDGC
jgi:hypothetical protein